MSVMFFMYGFILFFCRDGWSVIGGIDFCLVCRRTMGLSESTGNLSRSTYVTRRTTHCVVP